MLESLLHGDSCFATLTYDDKHLPEDGSLDPEDGVKWLKRLRKEIEPRRVRYYLAGEYGDVSWRPHFHVALFGVSQLETDLVERSWGMGHVMLGELNEKSASYIAKYVTKKLTKKEDPFLCGRYPEFSRMSRRPGLGAGFVTGVSAEYVSMPGVIRLDVPTVLMHGKKKWPLDRYLKRKLREAFKRSGDTPVAAVTKYKQEMQAVFSEEAAKDPVRARLFGKRGLYLDKFGQQMLNAEARAKIHSSKGGKL